MGEAGGAGGEVQKQFWRKEKLHEKQFMHAN